MCTSATASAFSFSNKAAVGFTVNSRTTKLPAVQSDVDLSVDGANRRKLLYSMLATATSSATFSSLTHSAAYADEMSQLAPTLVDWDNIGEIMKPPLDDRDYMVYIMDNGLRVILCSDPTSNEAGAAMDVHVGACSDPKEIPGLAHFNEHMLFLGTKEYPKEDSFEEFLAANGGSSNAYTASEDTVYHFTLQAEADEKLIEGLKRFGSFFTSPLFTESATGRELNAIDSENAKNLQSDNFRVYQIEKSRQNSDHPHSKFFTGNKKTLLEDSKRNGMNLREELIKFYTKYYSANQMTLAVVGPQSPQALRKMIDDAFGKVPNRNTSKPEDEWKGIIPPFNGNSVIPSYGHVVKLVPVQDLRQVTISWPIVYTSDEDKRNALLTKQANYAAHLIGHEGPGSLLSYLKTRGWANSLEASGNTELADFETFEVTVGLSRAGLEAVDKVIESIFSYLGMLRDKTIPSYVYNEVLQLEELQWRFSSKGGVGNYVQSMATSLQKYPPSLCVAGPRRLALARDAMNLETSSEPRSSFAPSQLDFTRTLTQNFVNNLTVDKALTTLISKSFQGKTDKKEKWYGSDYSVERIPDSTMEAWRKPPKPQALGLDFPRPNKFIPSEAGLQIKYPPTPVDRFRKRTFEERMTPLPSPEMIRDDGPEGRWTVYYKPDNRFGQPKAFVVFQLLTKEVSSSAKKAALANMYEFALTDKLTEYAYDAGLAGLTYDVRVVPRGVRLTFGGYNDKLQQFAEYVSKKASTDFQDVLPKDETEFERYKDLLSRTFAAFDVKQPYAHCTSFSQLLVNPRDFQYSNKDLRDATDAISLRDLTAYAENLWSSGKGIALVQGNIDQKEAETLVATIDKTLGFQPIKKEQYPPQLHPLPLPAISATGQPTRLVISEPNPENSNSASYVLLQSLSEDPKEHVLIELLSSVLSERFYEDLRTKQQLGYIVSSGIRALGKTRYIGFIVQSSVATNEKLTREILKFLDKARSNFLEKITEGDFAVYVKSLVDSKTEPDKQLATEVTRNWGEIGSGRLQFDRTQREAAAALDLTKKDLLEFWDNLYVKDGRRILITEVVPRVGVASTKAPPKSLGYNPVNSTPGTGPLLGIDDIESFRADQEKLILQTVDLERLG